MLKILALLNELPATSRKYQFAVAMADKIVDDNARDGHVELLQINRTALASAFARTSSLLYRSLSHSSQTVEDYSSPWSTRIVGSLPFGSYLVKGLGAVFPFLSSGVTQRQPLALEGACDDHVIAEKHAQELLWLTNKMRFCGVVDEALLQWSFATGLASISLTASPRVQGFIVKISGMFYRITVR